VSARAEPIDAAVREAVRTRLDRSLCVEAGAGTGKTTVLVERIVELVARGEAEVEQIAVITFTEKAAAELSARVRQRLEARAEETPEGSVRNRLERALAGLHRAHVETIHAFAGNVLRERPVEARLDPGFEVLDRLEAEIDFDRAYREWVTTLLAAPHPDLDRALNRGLHPRELRQAAEALEQHRHLIPLDPMTSPEPDLGGLVAWLEGEAAPELERLDPLCHDEEDPAHVQVPAVREFIRRVRSAAGDPEALERVVLFRGPGVKANAGRAENWPAGECRAMKDLLGELKARLEEVAAALRLEALAGVLPLVETFVEGYAEERRAAGRATYDDLLVRARDRVRDDAEVRAYFQRRFRRVLVDEFQDTDPIQAELVAWLTSDGSVEAAAAEHGAGPPDWRALRPEPGKLTVVGDPKQSIYRFRRADIAVYDEVKRGPLEGEVLTIVQNFRSLAPVLEWVNGVFDRLLADPVPGVQPGNAPLVAADRAPLPGPSVVSFRVEPSASASAVRDAEAGALAGLLTRVVGPEGWTVRERGGAREGLERPAAWGDIAVLFPWRTGIESWERALGATGIPFRTEGGRGFHERQEVRDLIAVLLAVDDPTDRISLVTALQSSACGASDEDLFAWVAAGGALDHRLPPDRVPEGAPASIREGLETLGGLHRERRGLSLPELVRRVLERTHMVEVALALPGGTQAAANLLKVADQAHGFAAVGGRGLRAFARWLAAQRDADRSPEEEAPVADAGDDVVRLLTIHAAKGLEFPIVALANLGSKPAFRKEPLADSGRSSLHLRVGTERDGRFTTPDFDAAVEAERALVEAERLRWLYVALTRARDRLIVPVAEKVNGSSAPMLEALRPSLPPEGAPAGVEVGGVMPYDAAELEQGAPARATVVAPAPAEAVEAARRARAAWAAEHAETVDAAGRERAMRTATEPEKERERPVLAMVPEEDGGAVPSTGGPAAEVGEALHLVMERLDLAAPAAVERTAAAACAEMGLTAAQVPEVAAMAANCLASESARRALRSSSRHREVPFTVSGADGALIAGRVDLVFEEEDALVVVDYKTDRVLREQAPAAAEGHRAQAMTYADALHRITGMRVREVVFVFARPGVEAPLGVPLPSATRPGGR